MRLELTHVGLLVELANHYTTRGALMVSVGGAHGVMVIVVENGHCDTSSNPGRD